MASERNIDVALMPFWLKDYKSYNPLERAAAMMFHVSLEEAEDGWIVAEVPALPGCVSQGKDEKEALDNIKESITAWMWAEDQKAAKSVSAGQNQVVVSV